VIVEPWLDLPPSHKDARSEPALSVPFVSFPSLERFAFTFKNGFREQPFSGSVGDGL